MQARSSTQTKATWANLILVVAMLGLLFMPAANVQAQQEQPQAKDESNPLLLVLPMPDREALRAMPAAKNPRIAKDMAADLLRQQAEPLFEELQALKSRGLIESYTFQPDAFGVEVYGAKADAYTEIARSSNVSYSAKDAQEAPLCAVKAAEALNEQLSVSAQIEKNSQERASRNNLETWMEVYKAVGSDYSRVYGYMPPSTPIRMEIERAGITIYGENSYSESDGWFAFDAFWVDCPQSGYNFVVQPGDLVRVMGGTTLEYTWVMPISGWGNPITNTVTGATAPNKTVELAIYTPAVDDCFSYISFSNVTAGPDGNFSTTTNTDLTAIGGVDLAVRDENGNATVSYATMFYLYAPSAPTTGFGLYLPPLVEYAAYHKRGASILGSKTGTTDREGWSWVDFEQALQHGDVIEVAGGGVVLAMYTYTINHSLNVDTNIASGTVGPYLRVDIHAYANNSNFSPSQCGTQWGCGVTYADAAGAFAVNANVDLKPGNYYYIDTYDQNGNNVYYRYNVPAIGFNSNYNELTVAWGPGSGSVTVVHKNASGAVLQTTIANPDSYQRRFWVSFSNTVNPGHIIEVYSADGQAKWMTVPNFTPRLHAGGGMLSGIAPNAGRLVTEVRDFNESTGFSTYRCQEQNVAAGAFAVSYPGQAWGSGDYALISMRDPNGNYFLRRAYAFTVNIWKDFDQLYGRTETPNTPITIKQTHGGVQLAPVTLTTDSTGYYFAFTGTPIQEGDWVEVSTGDGNSANIFVPYMSVLKDAAQNRMFGLAPPSSFLQLDVRRYYGGYYSTSYNFFTRTDSQGNYSVDLNDLFWQMNCSPVNVGDSCVFGVARHYKVGGYGIFEEGDYPVAVGNDAYEFDNTSDSATLYTGPQVHTFPYGGDEDWVKFTVTPEMLTKGYTEVGLIVSDLGWSMGIFSELYLKSDQGLQHQQTMYLWEYSTHRELVITTPGEYYLKFRPEQDNYSHSACDSRFTLKLSIKRNLLYAPALWK